VYLKVQHRAAFLAPDLVGMMLQGWQPYQLKPAQLTKDLPWDSSAQRRPASSERCAAHEWGGHLGQTVSRVEYASVCKDLNKVAAAPVPREHQSDARPKLLRNQYARITIKCPQFPMH
jgi:hypothetical protein